MVTLIIVLVLVIIAGWLDSRVAWEQLKSI